MEAGQHSQNSHPVYSDEIDLLQLCADLWQKRTLITLITFIVLAFGVSYAYMAPELYKAEARLLSPAVSSLSELTVVSELTEVANVSPEKAFRLTNQYLASMEVKRALLNSPVIAGYIEQEFPGEAEFEKLESLSEAMLVLLPDEKKKRYSTEVSVEWHDSGQAAELVNAWVDLAMKGARDELLKNTRVALKYEIRLVDEKIETKKRLALSKLNTELLKLREAKIIAAQNGLVEPVDITTESFVTNKPIFANVMELRALYLLGSKALSAEIGVLEHRRESVEDYMSDLAQMKEHRMKLGQSTLEANLVMTASIDAVALPPETRFKPKRMLIMLVSLVIGVVVGFFVALIVDGLEKKRSI